MIMKQERKVEVFTAGCPACEPTVELVKRIACPSCDVQVLDMHRPDVAAKARQYGVTRVPAIAINGKLVECCAEAGPDETTLRAEGLGVPL
jgi:glutaredoxin 3